MSERKNNKYKLTSEEEKALVKFMKANTFMWDVNHKEYKNMIKKNLKWKELADKLGKDVEKLKKRWKNIKDYERRKNLTSPSEIAGLSEEELELEVKSEENTDFFKVWPLETLNDEEFEEYTLGPEISVISSDTETSMPPTSAVTLSAPKTRINKRKNEDDFNMYTSKRATLLETIATSSQAISSALKQEKKKTSFEKLWPIYGEEVMELPIEIRDRCIAELKILVTGVIIKYQEEARE